MVEPRGLEPLTPCLQIRLDETHKMALTYGNVETALVKNGQKTPIFPPQVPQAMTSKHGVSFFSPTPSLCSTTQQGVRGPIPPWADPHEGKGSGWLVAGGSVRSSAG